MVNWYKGYLPFLDIHMNDTSIDIGSRYTGGTSRYYKAWLVNKYTWLS